ncbi:MAG: GatB/YqeY domain-containing protein [Burkholderiaceae bacterium]
MSTLYQTIQSDMKDAMRAKDAPRLGTIRMLLAACKQKEVDERVALTDTMVVGLVDKLIKQRRDSVQAYSQAGRTDLADIEAAEIEVLQAYLPARLSAAEVQQAVLQLVRTLEAKGPADMGRVMAAAKAELASQADMAEVSAAVKRALAQTS